MYVQLLTRASNALCRFVVVHSVHMIQDCYVECTSGLTYIILE
jgi:hypothetical protein